MAIRETLSLDMTPALGGLGQLDARLSAIAKQFQAELAAATKVASGSVSVSGAEKAQADLAGVSRAAGATKTSLEGVGAGAFVATDGVTTMGPALEGAGKGLEGTSKKAQSADESLKKVGNTALIAGGALALGIGVAVARAADFEKNISLVGAVADTTAANLDRLREAAITAGQATIFSASEAAQAEAELAKAGVSVADILGGALTGSLNLAAAGQLDLATSATITAQALKIFGLDGSEATRVADVLAAGANKSATDVVGLGEGMVNAGAVAKTLGLSLEDTVGALALFADRGLDAQVAGDSLKRALIELSAPSAQQSTAMKELSENAKAAGVEIQNASNPFFDAQGRFIGLARASEVLQEGMRGYTDQQKAATLATLGGSFGLQALQRLYDAGPRSIREYTKAVNDQGAAQQFASKQLDNLSGDLEQLRGSLETVLIQEGSKATAGLRFLAQGVTDVLNGISELPGPIQAVGGGLVAFSAAGLLGLGAITKLVAAFSEFQKSAGNLNPALGTAVGALGKVAGAAAIALPSIALIKEDSEAAGIGIAGMAASGALLGSAIPGVGTAVGAAAGVVAGLTTKLIAGEQSVEDYRESFVKLGSELDSLNSKQAGQSFVDNLGIEDLIALSKGGEDAVRGIKDELLALGKSSPDAVDKVVKSLKAMRDEDGKPLITGQQLEELDGIVARVNENYKTNAKNARDAKDANLELAGGTEDAAGATSEFAESLDAANTAADNYKKTLDALLGIGLDVESANLKFRDSIQAVNEAIEKNGRTLDINTEAGRNNREALLSTTEAALGLAEAQFKQDGNTEAANATISTQIGYLNSVAHQMGLTDEQALVYIEDLLGIPPDVRTDITNTADLARYVTGLLENKYNDLDGRVVTTTLSVNDQATARALGLTDALNQLDGKTATAQLRLILDTTGIPSAVAPLVGLGGLARGGVAFGAHGLVGKPGQIVGPRQPVLIGEGLSREAVVPFDNFADMVATIRATGRPDEFLRAAFAAGGATSFGGATGAGAPIVFNIAVSGVSDPGVGKAVGRQIGAGAAEALQKRGLITAARVEVGGLR